MSDETDNHTADEQAVDIFSPWFGCEAGRIDPSAWQLETPDHEHGADLCDIDPCGMVS